MYRLLGTLVAFAFLAAPTHAASFRNDVMAVLSRAGCNSGPCHGNLNGKGGFRLSLRGENPDADYLALTRDTLARRIDVSRPETSLLLSKATMSAAHEGGLRFNRDSGEYRILRDWITAGAGLDSPTALVKVAVTPASAVLHHPTESATLKVVATFADGSARDVTRLACFEPSTLSVRVDAAGVARRVAHGETAVIVRYLHLQGVSRLAFLPERAPVEIRDEPNAGVIDRLLAAKWREHRIRPAALSSDAEFLRRAYLDGIGVLPTPAEARRFVADERPDKRARLIDALLERNEFADFWALKWSDLLRNEEKVLDTKGVRAFHGWIRQAFIDRVPLDRFAYELIASRGSTYTSPAANYYRALRDPYSRAEAMAQVFLGTRLQCAKCHNHPYDNRTQTDYHRFAALFARVEYKIVENNRRDNLDKHEFVGEQIVIIPRAGELSHPVSKEALTPRFLGADLPTDAKADRLRLLADWTARADNPFFARAQANRVWAHLMGRGLVDPVDDFRDSNPSSLPALTDALGKELSSSGFDLRYLVRLIMNSRAYQLSARPADASSEDAGAFAAAISRPLQAEQLHDAASGAAGVRPRLDGLPRGSRAGQMPGVSAGKRGRKSESERFLATFGKPERSLSCECERSEDTTLAQALQLFTGPLVDRLVSEPDNRVGKLLASGASDARIVEELYLAALCRPPSPRERDLLGGRVAAAKDRRGALEDVLWGLLNSKEFLMRR